MSIHSQLTDKDLYAKCREYGGNARLWMRKFAGLLPEVFKRHLYKRRKCASIHEFAAKMGGMNHDTTDKILRLAARLKNNPKLLNALESGSQGWSKIEAIAYIAMPENDAFWADKIETLGRAALIEYVRELKRQEIQRLQNNRLESTAGGELNNVLKVRQYANSEIFGQINQGRQPTKGDVLRLANAGLFGAGMRIPVGDERRVSETNESFVEGLVPRWPNLSFSISPMLKYKLDLYKQRFERAKKQTMSWNEVLEELVKMAESGEEKRHSGLGIESTETMRPKSAKTKDIALCPSCIKSRQQILQEYGHPTRHIPVEVKKLIEVRSEHKCEFPGCNKPPNIFHHTRRFAKVRGHDPDAIRYLCTAHERLVHSGLIENEEKDPSSWRVRSGWFEQSEQVTERERTAHIMRDSLNRKSAIDDKVNRFRVEKAPAINSS